MSKPIDEKLVKAIVEYQIVKKALESTAILLIRGNPTLFFVRQYNAERQALMEIVFSEECVPSPQAVRVAIKGYVF